MSRWELALHVVDELSPAAGSQRGVPRRNGAGHREAAPHTKHADVIVNAPGPLTGAVLAKALFDRLGPIEEATAALTLDGRLLTPTTIVAAGSVARGAMLRRSGPHRATRSTGASASAVPQPVADLHLAIATGPRAGSILPLERPDASHLATGHTVIGRAELGDPSVSARHASIEVGSDGAIVVRDLASLNGTTVDGTASTMSAGVTTGIGAVLRLGAVVARVEGTATALTHPIPPVDASVDATAGYSVRGTRTLHRGPRLLVVGEATPIAVPGSRPALAPPRLRWVSIVLPLLLAGAIVAVTGDPRFGLLALLGPLLAAGTYLEDRRQYRRGRRRDEAAEAGDLDAFRQALLDQRHRAFADAHARVVDPPRAARIAHLLECASDSFRSTRPYGRSDDRVAGLWERRRTHPDFGLVTLAYATLHWKPTLDSSGHTNLASAQAALAECAEMADAPVTTLLHGGSSVGFTGPRPATLAAVRAVLVELAISCGPADLAIAVLTSPEHADDWAWAAWLPHVGPLDDGGPDCAVAVTAEQVETMCAAIVATRTRVAPQGGGASASGVAAPEGPALVVVVVDDEDLARRGDPALQALSARVELDRLRRSQPHGEGPRSLDASGSSAGPALALLSISKDSAGLVVSASEVLTLAGDGTASSVRTTFAAAASGPVLAPAEVFDAIGVNMPETVAHRVARALARLDDPESAGRRVPLPATVPLSVALEASGVPFDPLAGTSAHELGSSRSRRASDLASPLAMVARWGWGAGGSGVGGSGVGGSGADGLVADIAVSCAAPIGWDDGGPLVADLVADGPHALVAGTTGSGKSELLRAWISALAARYSPEALNLLLIDYKGGSAFAECAALPHCAGLVTDLDEHLGRRALRCLEAELTRRERVLRDAGVPDFAGYWALVRGAGIAPLPRMIVVVDEFATLAAELPGFVDSLVGVAQRGRSLGIHLILATQRPAGAVSESIRANTNLRISLRVHSAADSMDVIGTGVAAALSRHTPGRAYARFGPGEVIAFQAAYASAIVSAHSGAIVVRPLRGGGVDRTEAVSDEERSDEERSDEERSDEERSELAALVEAATRAAEVVGAATPRSPWPEELPASFGLADLGPAEPSTSGAVGFGWRDEPDAQRRTTLAWDVDDGPLLVVGAPGAGVTTTLATVALAVAATTSPVDVHLHVIDHGTGRLGALEALAHVGVVARAGERERQDRLVRWLRAEASRRREVLAGLGLGRWSEAEPALGVDRLDLGPRLVVLVDDVGAFRSDRDDAAGTAIVDTLHRLVVEGTAVGIHLAVGADRPGAVPSAVLTGVRQRIVLRINDRYELAAFGVNLAAGDVPLALPGRGVEVATGCEVHIADCGPLPLAVSELTRLHGADWDLALSSGGAAMRLAALPSFVEQRELDGLAVPGEQVDPDGTASIVLPIGIGDADLAPVGIVLGEGEGLVITGPPRSGRSSTLALLASQFLAVRPDTLLRVLTTRRSGLCAAAKGLGAADMLDRPTGDEVVAWCSRAAAHVGPQLLLVDDADLLDDTAKAFEKLLAQRRPDLWVIVAGRADGLRSTYGHWSLTLRRSRQGVALRPNVDTDGDVWSTPLPRRTGAFPVGRGVLVRDGQCEVVQVARAGTMEATVTRRSPGLASRCGGPETARS